VSGVKLIFKEKVVFNIKINKKFRILFGKRKGVWGRVRRVQGLGGEI
jgi:hypothetical protein